MKVTVLGCGSSGGVPLIGNNWGACDPSDPRNRRTRVSILIEEDEVATDAPAILVDTSPDLRQQLLACGKWNLGAVIYTHAHADHCHGIDELRSVNWMTKKPVAVHADARTMQELRARFGYVFPPVDGGHDRRSFYKPAIEPRLIEGPFRIGGLDIFPFTQTHGKTVSLGLRIGDFAYSTDVNALDGAAFRALEGVRVWIVDCVRETEHPTHAHLPLTLEWIARVKPERAYLTHMSDALDYAALAAKLPPGVAPAHDGLTITC